MTEGTTPRRVLVLGGGVLGTSVAVHLQRRGAEVVLVTEAGLASGASGRSLSWLNGHSPDDAYRSLRAAGIDRYRTLFAADPSRPWLRFDGGLWWTMPERSQDALARHSEETDHGYDSQLLSRADIADHVAGVAAGPAEHLAVHNPGEGGSPSRTSSPSSPASSSTAARSCSPMPGAARSRCRTAGPAACAHRRASS